MVAPYFSRLHRADPEFSMLLVIASMALCPILAPLLLALVSSTSVSLNLAPLTRYMLLLITLPLLVSAVIAAYLPNLRRFIARYEGYTNSITLALLIFALFGTIVGKLNTNYIDTVEISTLLVLVFVQDFGVLFLSRYLLPSLLRLEAAHALIIAASMKNVAIAAGVLLIYDPRASFAPALAFIAHAVLFSFLANTRLSGWVLSK
jgi:predicted Na+-dependent transporter